MSFVYNKPNVCVHCTVVDIKWILSTPSRMSVFIVLLWILNGCVYNKPNVCVHCTVVDIKWILATTSRMSVFIVLLWILNKLCLHQAERLCSLYCYGY